MSKKDTPVISSKFPYKGRAEKARKKMASVGKPAQQSISRQYWEELYGTLGKEVSQQ